MRILWSALALIVASILAVALWVSAGPAAPETEVLRDGVGSSEDPEDGATSEPAEDDSSSAASQDRSAGPSQEASAQPS